MNEEIEELQAEIDRLEAVANLDSEEYRQLKALREQLKTLEAVVEADLARKGLSVRPLSRRDIQVLQTLVKEYPRFKELNDGERLDRIVLVLTQVCGFGGVFSHTITSALEMIPYKLEVDIEQHFLTAMWTNREGDTRRRYVNNFGSAFKLEPGLTLKLISESKERPDEEPIRKSVVKKAAPVAPKLSSPEELSKQGTVRVAEKAKPPTVQAKAASPDKAVSPAATAKPTTEIKKPEASSGSSANSDEDKKGIKDKLFSFFKK